MADKEEFQVGAKFFYNGEFLEHLNKTSGALVITSTVPDRESTRAYYDIIYGLTKLDGSPFMSSWFHTESPFAKRLERIENANQEISIPFDEITGWQDGR